MIAAFFALGVVAVAAGLEGGTLPEYGGVAVSLAGLGLLAVGVRDRGGATSRTARFAFGGLILLVLWQALPVPEPLRRLVAPGQAAKIAAVAPEWPGDEDALSAWLTDCDVAAVTGETVPASPALAGSVSTVARPGSIDRSALPWVLAQVAGALAVFAIAVQAGRDARARGVVVTGFLLLAVVEAVFGIAMRDGPSTGIGVKTAYLGSATGTFINRGHFAMFLGLGVAAAWAVAGAQFPLLPAEVERHRERVRRSSQPPGLLEASGNRVPKLLMTGLAVSALGIGMVSAQSRGPLLVVVLASLALGGALWRARGERFYFGFALGFPVVTGLLGGLAFGPRGAFGRFQSVITGIAEDVSATSRLQFWRDGLKAWLDAPLFGAGLGTWRLAYGLHESVPHLYEVRHAHDEAVELLAEGGLLGLAVAVLASLALVRALVPLWSGEHGSATTVGVTAGLGLLVAGGCSIGDFPLHTPGTAFAVALLAGVGVGAASDAPAWGRGLRGLVAVAAVGLGASAAVADHARGGPRNERLGEVPAEFLHAQQVDGPAAAADRLDRAMADVAAAPLDPWRQLAMARAAAWVAREGEGKGAAGVLARARSTAVAELGLARVQALRPEDPRLLLLSAAVLLDLQGNRECRLLRARELLAHAIRLDAWRADAAFQLAAPLPVSDLDVLAAGRGTGRGAARVDYALGRELARRRAMPEAVAAYRQATVEDPSFGPPFFQLAAVENAAGHPDETRAWVHRFLAARERPGGMEGWAYLLIGDLDAAEVRLRGSIAELPSNLWAWEGLAELYARRGDTRQEEAAWRAVLKLQPGHRKALDRLRVLGAG